MRRRLPRRRALAILAALVTSASWVASGVAHAQEKVDKAACANAYEQAQRQRQAHELKSARKDLLVCSRPGCPSWVRQDCVPWLAEVDAAMPSIVVSTRDPDGATRTNARVIVDGVTVMDPVTPDPIALDPGEHVLVVVAPGSARVEKRIALEEGERGRRIEITLDPFPDASDPLTHSGEAARRGEGESGDGPLRPTPPLVYILGTAGIAIAGVGTYVTLSGLSARSDLFDCAPSCSTDAVSDARTQVWAGNVVIGVGVVSLAAALVVYLTRPTIAPSSASSSR